MPCGQSEGANIRELISPNCGIARDRGEKKKGKKERERTFPEKL